MIPHRWRSLLFVPADNPRLIGKADQRGADALILDLEDSVPAAGKAAARASLPRWTHALAERGAAVVVRVNREAALLGADLEAAAQPGVRAILVPKVERPEELAAVDAALSTQEHRRGLADRSIGLVGLIESPEAVFRLRDLAGMPRVIGLALGTEDFALGLGVAPTPACLTLPCQTLALAAAAAGVMALAMPVSIAGFRDLDGYRAGAVLARAMGATGALCIHPSQVAVLNESFAPTEAERAWAAGVLAVWTEAEAKGSGAVSFAGAMIDKPVVERARAILALG